MKIAEVMTTELITVEPDTPLRDAAQLMLTHHVSGLPVTSLDGTLLGIVTEADFVDEEAAHAMTYRPRLLDVLTGRAKIGKRLAGSVAEVMSKDVVTVRTFDSVDLAARQMKRAGVKRLPVVDKRGALVGIVSRADILKVFVRTDEDILAEIEELLMHGIIGVDAHALELNVVDGVVEMKGRIETFGDVAALRGLVRRVPGVIEVNAAVEWEVDDRVSPERFPGYPQEGADV